MKLVLREYLASLREREELDAILPDLLSELGFTVYSRPGIGTTQHGVDIAAVGPPGADGTREVYLLSVKKGDLTRAEWNGSTAQALRPSLDDILDSYIPTRIPPEYRGLKIVICLCFGGDMREEVRTAVNGYTTARTTAEVRFEEWNGDRIAGMLLAGVLREDLLPKPFRRNFQKAVAMLDEPSVAYDYFTRLVRDLRQAGTKSVAARVRAARQIYVSVWVMFVWGRDLDNLEAPFLASELALLNVWELYKPLLGRRTRDARAIGLVILQLHRVHLQILDGYIEGKIAPHVGTRDALGTAVASRAHIDVNLALFDLLGRIAMAGLWLDWSVRRATVGGVPAGTANLGRYVDMGLKLIDNNRALLLPATDEQATAIALFLLLWMHSRGSPDAIAAWLEEMTRRNVASLVNRNRYPTSKTDYADVLIHPASDADAYFQDATAGSTLAPLLSAWLTALGVAGADVAFGELKKSVTPHCEMQAWSVDELSEAHLYVNDAAHGRAITGLPVGDGKRLIATLHTAVKAHADFESLSAMRYGWHPLVLTACRHYRLPVPPEFYVGSLVATLARREAVAAVAGTAEAS